MLQSITSVGFILVCIQVSYLLVAQEQREFWVTGSAPCGASYEYLQGQEGVRAMCCIGFINATLHQCQPSSETCPPNIIAARRSRQKRSAENLSENELTLHSRQKRQANRGQSCDRTFSCPSDLASIYIYPDWSNRQCDTYVQCENGVSTLISCTEFGLRYYNPRLLSCENTSTLTNTCIHRLGTDLSQLF